ncbi:52 kDa repressor of the inhibitor of the protein kinase-like [Cyprinodon tularosa]|uniref:52 kDa repressor of the inhibitor of the protein kinase-like n=1 Tax=Cyprinodon tularosa TaxID=77115 RepID=UPI0018E28E1D|nr:52 kDa repressor of the inhibitor of the protein kinase-like [Cyprinodon tularosa]
MQHGCVVQGCPSGTSDFQALFRFPRDPNRSQKWVEQCQRTDLKDKPAQQLFRYYRLCGKHFEASAFNTDAPGSVLKPDAIPSVFDVPAQPQTGKAATNDDETERRGRKRFKKAPAEPVTETAPAVPEEDDEKTYLKTLFEVLVLLGEQSIPPSAPSNGNNDDSKMCNFQALLEYRLRWGDEVLKKKIDPAKQNSLLQKMDALFAVCEQYVRSKVIEEVKQNGFFSLITDEPLKISGEWCLPVFLRYVDQSKNRQERFVGFLPFEGNADDLPEKLLEEMTEQWGLDMSQCRAQAHSCSGTHSRKIKAFASKLVEKYPKAVLTFRSAHPLNLSLANSMSVSGVQLVLSTFKKIEAFFSQSPLLQVEFEHAISIFYPDREDKAEELKKICQTRWTQRNDGFEVALEVIEALLLCVDSVHDNEEMRWNDQVTHSALEISKAITDFEFIIALIVLKNIMALIQAFGKNLQGKAADIHAAAASLNAVLLSLKEVQDNIDVYCDFFYDDAVNLATAMEIPVKVPRSFLRKCREEAGTVQTDVYYKERLCVPAVHHVVGEMNDLFCQNHRRALGCLSLIPDIIEANKSGQPDEENLQLFNDDIPNAGSLSAELKCWWVKWGKKAKGETFPSSLHDTLQLADVKFFPNVFTALRLIGILPTLAMEDGADVAFKRFQMYTENMADSAASKSLALLNVNYNVGFDLDSLVEIYQKMYPERTEV